MNPYVLFYRSPDVSSDCMALEVGSTPNSETMVDEDTGSINATIGMAIGETLRTTLGPNGMDKMLVDTNGMVLLTNDGKTVLGEMGVNLDLLPAGRFLKEVALEQDDSVGDGTTTAVVIASELLRKAIELLEVGLHPTTISHGYALAARRANKMIAGTGTTLELTDTKAIEQVVRTGIAGWSSARDEDTLASLIVETTSELATTGGLCWDRLVVRKICGGEVADSSLRRGTVFEGEPVHSAMPRILEPAKVACLNTNLTPKQTSVKHGDFTVRSPDDLDVLLKFESEDVKSKVQAIVESGANVIFSDKSIDDHAQQLLTDQGVLAVRRMAESDLRTVARATGAMVSDATTVESSDLGDATRIEHQNLSGDDVFFIATENAERLVLVLRGGTEQVLNEMERAAQNGFAAVRAIHRDPRIVPGGGAVEIELALVLREYADTISTREQLAISAFADALETIPQSLAESSGLDPVDSLIELRHRHAMGDTQIGVRATEGHIDDVLAVGIVDPVRVKQRSIASAADIVSRIIRIDGVLAAKSNSKDTEAQHSETNQNDLSKTNNG